MREVAGLIDGGLYIDVAELMALLKIKKTKAYEIIKQVNKELESKGYITISGKAPRKYLMARLGVEV